MPTPALRSSRGPTVLVVEDDADLRDLLRTHLRRLGWQVWLAGSGEEALALVVTGLPDVALVDVLLPGMDGREVVARLQQRDRERACRVVLTSVLDVDDLAGCGAPVVDGHLPKPFSRRDVTRVLAALHPDQRPTEEPT